MPLDGNNDDGKDAGNDDNEDVHVGNADVDYGKDDNDDNDDDDGNDDADSNDDVGQEAAAEGRWPLQSYKTQMYLPFDDDDDYEENYKDDENCSKPNQKWAVEVVRRRMLGLLKIPYLLF